MKNRHTNSLHVLGALVLMTLLLALSNEYFRAIDKTQAAKETQAEISDRTSERMAKLRELSEQYRAGYKMIEADEILTEGKK